MMRTLIIGGTSSIGTALKPVLAGFSEVITAGRKNCDIHIDLNDPVENMHFPDNIDAVIHTAAHFGGTSAKEVLEAETVNVLGTLKVCQAAVQANVRHFILISSIYTSLPEKAEQYSIYALSKKHAEEVAGFYCSMHSLPLTILRLSQLYGSGENFRRHQPFFYTMIDKAQKGEDISLYGVHDPLRNFIHIDDITKIIAKVAENKIEGIYSCTQTTDVSYSQIAKAAFSAFNSKATVHFLKDKKSIPDNIFEKDDTLYKMIGFYPGISIEEGIKKIAQSKKSSI